MGHWLPSGTSLAFYLSRFILNRIRADADAASSTYFWYLGQRERERLLHFSPSSKQLLIAHVPVRRFASTCLVAWLPGIAFVEGILPGLDFIPTATIAWFLSEIFSGLASIIGRAIRHVTPMIYIVLSYRAVEEAGCLCVLVVPCITHVLGQRWRQGIVVHGLLE